MENIASFQPLKLLRQPDLGPAYGHQRLPKRARSSLTGSWAYPEQDQPPESDGRQRALKTLQKDVAQLAGGGHFVGWCMCRNSGPVGQDGPGSPVRVRSATLRVEWPRR